MHKTTQSIETHVNCPNCGHDVDVNDILSRKLEADIQKKYDTQLKEEHTRLNAEQRSVEAKLREITAKEKDLAAQINAGIERRINAERTTIAKEERAKAEALQESNTRSLQQELAEKSEQLKELHESKAAVLRLQREKDSLKSTLEAENEQKLKDLLNNERLVIQKNEANKSELKIKEREHLIDTLKKQLDEAQRKAEQGSMQVQGEVQELAVEDWLRCQYPQDHIEEVKKGALGADCIQTVHNSALQACGKICFESKRTKAFQPAWIEKFKADIRDCNAEIGVIVSQARPAGHDRMAMIDGIWVCNFEEFKGLTIALRNQIIEVDRVTHSQVNQEEKVQLLWKYLQSNEFRLQVEGIVEGFSTLKSDLEKEKRAIKQQWKRREKQIDKVLDSTTNMYGAIRGIAGASIQPVAALEFDEN
jgi:hypothetical protein